VSIPIGAGVRRFSKHALGKVVRGPRRASRGMLWVKWDDMPRPVMWQRCTLVYVARRYADAVAWDKAMMAREVHSKPLVRTIEDIRQACADRRHSTRICSCTLEHCCRTV
jgi:UTP:GlnB (protein PII) uridylyltransferase